MATKAAKVEGSNWGSTLVTWEGLAQGDDGAPVRLEAYTDKTVQVVGTFGTGGTVVWEGSLDGTTWGALHDPQGATLSVTDSSCEVVAESPIYIRPRVSAGDGSTALTAMLVAIDRRA